MCLKNYIRIQRLIPDRCVVNDTSSFQFSVGIETELKFFA